MREGEVDECQGENDVDEWSSEKSEKEERRATFL